MKVCLGAMDHFEHLVENQPQEACERNNEDVYCGMARVLCLLLVVLGEPGAAI